MQACRDEFEPHKQGRRESTPEWSLHTHAGAHCHRHITHPKYISNTKENDQQKEMDMVAHAQNLSSWEAEARGQQVWIKSVIYSEVLSYKIPKPIFLFLLYINYN